MINEILLNKLGWVVECESPLEIRHEDGSFATGQAALIIIENTQSEYKCDECNNTECICHMRDEIWFPDTKI